MSFRSFGRGVIPSGVGLGCAWPTDSDGAPSPWRWAARKRGGAMIGDGGSGSARALVAAMALVLLGLLQVGCAINRADALPPTAQEHLDLDYRVAPGDTLAVFVWDNPDLSIVNVPVRPDGKITTPLAEDVVAAGKTATELARSIRQQLTRFVREPYVTVTVTEFVGLYSQQIRVVGDGVKEAKSIPYRDGMTLLDVVIAIGGMTEFAKGNDAMLIRTVEGRETRYRARLDDLLRKGEITANASVLPGDVLIIPEASWL